MTDVLTMQAPSDRLGLQCAGEMAELIGTKDWSLTALGPMSAWPLELKSHINTILCAPIPMFLFWGSDLTLIYNDAARPIASTKHPACLGQSARQVWEEAWHLIGPEVERTFSTGESTNQEGVLVPIIKEGALQDLWWDYTRSAVYVGDNIAGVLTVCQDVTSSAIAERERAAMAARLNQVLEVTTESVVTINREWRITYLNPAALRSMSPVTDALGKNFWETFPAALEPGSPYLEHYPRAMDERIAAEFESFYPEPINIWVHVQVRPTEDGIALFYRDITTEKKSLAALLQTEKLAAVGRLAASIAHEINNPLASVTNLLYLAHHGETSPKVKEYLSAAERELRRVSAISNQTLRFYKQASNPRPVQPDDLLDSVLSIYQGRLLNARVTLERRRSATGPLFCFEGEIRQVLSKLVGNAIDAMNAAGGRLYVRVQQGTDWVTRRPGVVFTIGDDGQGISDQVRSKIFDAFYTTKGLGGTGLGLWVSQEIVDRHNGRLRLRSSQTQGRSGTVFRLFLPFDAPAR